MARIELRIANPAHTIILKALLEAEGHLVGASSADVVISDDLEAPVPPQGPPILLLATAAQLPDAVKAMRRGAYGYIMAPFIPGEAGMMVQRALGQRAVAQSTPLATLDEVEAAHIRAVLRSCKNNHSQAARVLGIGRNTLWRKLKQHPKAETRGTELFGEY